jgi:hypothetical protein
MTSQTATLSVPRATSRILAGIGRLLTTTPETRMAQAAGNVLKSPFPEGESIKIKRAEAIEKLGEKWVLHSNYKPNPRHSNDAAIWWPHRTLKYNG